MEFPCGRLRNCQLYVKTCFGLRFSGSEDYGFPAERMGFLFGLIRLQHRLAMMLVRLLSARLVQAPHSGTGHRHMIGSTA